MAAAHELKTPLTIILHLATLLSSDNPDLSEFQKQQLLSRIKLSAERTLNLVNGLTISHRLDDKTIAFPFILEPVNVSRQCRDILNELKPLADQYQQKIILECPLKNYLAVANVDLLRSIIYNLVDNAIRHNDSQSVVRVSLRRTNNSIRLCVKDNGLSLGRKEITNLRQTLGARLQPLSGRAGSSGLGLYIASRLATSMGAKLGVGTDQKSTSFYVDLMCSKQLSLL